jgi:hypothetical protein
MSKIYIADHLGGHKTTIQLEKWFASRGHEVHWNMYYEPKEAEWCDVMIFEWCEGMVELALKDGWGKRKPMFCRAVDIEIWSGQPNNIDLSDLTGLAYMSKAYWKYLDSEAKITEKYPKLKTEWLPLSIDMNEWTFSDRSLKNKKIAILGHMWDAKGMQLIPQFVRQLIDKTEDDAWQFFVQGYWRHDVWQWYYYYFKHIIKEVGLEKNIFINEDRVDSIDEWLEDKSALITFSMKDAFSLIVGEAMAKGIKALPHNFMGAKDIWKQYVWTTLDELMFKLVDEVYDSQKYYKFVKTHYSNEVIMPKWEKFIGL